MSSRSRLRFFAKAIGETDPIYTDEAAARDAGLSRRCRRRRPSCCAEQRRLGRRGPHGPAEALDLARILHGEQAFDYHQMAYAGDTLRFETTVTDIYDKKGGALHFAVVNTTRVPTNQRGEHWWPRCAARSWNAVAKETQRPCKLPSFNEVQVGDELPPLALPPVNRTTLALYAGASGDHNPIHIDIDVARRARMPDVFAQGMLAIAYLGPPAHRHGRRRRQVRNVAIRFTGITHLGNQPYAAPAW